MFGIIKKISFLLVVASIFGFTTMFSVANAAGEAVGKRGLASIDADTPILVIRFNQQHVYYQEPLKQVVSEVRGVRGDAIYEVRSILPSAMQQSEDEQAAKKAETRLLLVLAELKKLGVAQDKVSADTTYSDDVKTQEIKIFVK